MRDRLARPVHAIDAFRLGCARFDEAETSGTSISIPPSTWAVAVMLTTPHHPPRACVAKPRRGPDPSFAKAMPVQAVGQGREAHAMITLC